MPKQNKDIISSFMRVAREDLHYVIILETDTHEEGWYLTKAGEKLMKFLYAEHYPLSQYPEHLDLDEW